LWHKLCHYIKAITPRLAFFQSGAKAEACRAIGYLERSNHNDKTRQELPMEVHNAVTPTAEQIEGFLAPDATGPIYMLNLLKFKAHAEYEDGRETSLSGREAYALYAAEVAKVITQVGGKLTFAADVARLMLGEVEELWDQVGIAMYPSRAAMFQMIQLPKYAEISVHRTAGLAGQLNIETVAPPAG
jgi:uncharacterized protein (DUF1330 family)